MKGASLLGLLTLYFISAVLAFNPAPAGLWFLNTYLKSQTIGRFETLGSGVFSPTAGYCPDNAHRCQLNFATLPSSVKSIGVVIPPPFNSSLSLGQAIPTGVLSIWELELNDVEIGTVTVSGTSLSPQTEQIHISVTGF